MKREIILGGGLVLLIIIGVAFFYYRQNPNELPKAQERGKTLSFDISDKVSAGDISGALQAYQSVISSPDISRIEIAPSVIIGAGLAYRVSGSTTDAIAGVEQLKQAASDQSVRPFIRALAIVQLALAANNTGHNFDVFNEVFKSQPYQEYLVRSEDGKTNTVASARNLLLYSYRIYPTAQSAVAISDYSIVELYRNEQLGLGPDRIGDRNQVLVSSAETYLAHAADLSVPSKFEQAQDPSAGESYLVNRAFAIGGLAHFKGAPYSTQYRDEYANLFDTLTSSGMLEAKGTAAVSHFWYAAFLLQVDKDTLAAKAELSKAIALAKADPYFESDPLVSRVRKLKSGTAPYEAPAKLEDLTNISTEFKAFVDSIK